MIDKIGNYVYKKFGGDIEYYVKVFLYYSEMLITMAVLSYFFNNWYMAIIGTFVMNIIRFYTYGFHCKKLENCVVFTNIIFLIFGYISMATYKEYLWVAFLLYSCSVRYIWIKMPLELQDNKTIEWHKNGFEKWISIITIISLIFLYFNLYLIVSTILWSVIMVAILLFINGREGV